jgi:hypothetical protein
MVATNLNSGGPGLTTVTNNLRDIRPPVDIPNAWIWVWIGLALLAFAAILVAAWRYWQRQRLHLPAFPLIPAHVRAKQKLQEALALISQPQPFCFLVSDTIRVYLEERFSFHAPERTTEEFLHELRATDLLTAEQKQSLAEFLQRCDLVKFARYDPREPELHDLHSSAVRLVEETEPALAAVHEAQAAMQGAQSPAAPK